MPVVLQNADRHGCTPAEALHFLGSRQRSFAYKNCCRKFGNGQPAEVPKQHSFQNNICAAVYTIPHLNNSWVQAVLRPPFCKKRVMLPSPFQVGYLCLLTVNEPRFFLLSAGRFPDLSHEGYTCRAVSGPPAGSRLPFSIALRCVHSCR